MHVCAHFVAFLFPLPAPRAVLLLLGADDAANSANDMSTTFMWLGMRTLDVSKPKLPEEISALVPTMLGYRDRYHIETIESKSNSWSHDKLSNLAFLQSRST